MCLKKHFPLPQKLRNMKFKQYPFWRIDKPKTQIIQGGWHFSFLHNPENIIKKIKSFSHGEFNTDKITDEKNIIQKISRNEDIFERGVKLKKIEINNDFPDYIINNKDRLSKWIL